MKSPPEITDLATLIEPHLNGGKVVSYSSKFLTKPGDNYGSIMLSITANVKNTNGQIEEVPLVAKMPPIFNDFYWNVFEPQRTCLTENAVYMELASAIDQLQRNANVPEDQIIEIFPKFFGARLSLNSDSETVDRDALLVLENLQTNGYRAGNRSKMFDYDHAVVILKYLAAYHAFPIALRTLKPFEFKTKLLPFFQRFDINKNLGPEVGKEMTQGTLDQINQITNNNEDIVQKFIKLMEENGKYMSNPEQCPDGLYTTIAHFDFWINNMMILYDENGKPNKVKIVDFQLAQYDSLAHDLVFFLLSSVETQVLDEHYEELLKFYYDHLILNLKRVGCPTSEYSFKSFQDEINRIAPIQIPHVIFMIKVILYKDETLPENFEDINPDLLMNDSGYGDKFFNKMRDVLRQAQTFGYL